MKLLMCSDGSETAERAIRLGAGIAAACQAEVTLLGINETAADSTPLMASLQRGQALLEEKKIHAELVTKTGDPIAEIVRRTQETHYDLAVIGAARKEARGPYWMSSKSYKIIKEIKPPVLAVAGKIAVVKRILICAGGKRYIDSTVRLAGEIAHGLNAAVVLLHVLPEPPAIYAGLRRMEETVDRVLASNTELGQNLRREKEMLEAAGVAAEVRLRHGSVLEEILSEIHEGDYDLIVTGSALSRSLRTYVLGDVSREIVNRTQCAVLVGRSQQEPSRVRFSFKDWLGRLGPHRATATR